ncbi:MAG: hypothetical protein GC137_00750 [Alphaproteobacteria bacterium]|nr:hypothetical protein [Alphaproteobacteria bacterium]
MSELLPLIRVRKHAIEQKQKFLAELYRQAEELQHQRDTLETQLAIETEKTRHMEAEMLRFFEPYARSVKIRIEDIDADRETLEQRIARAQDEMREAFAELKKIEIIDDRRAEEELAELEKREAEILDEIAIDQFQRQQKGD